MAQEDNGAFMKLPKSLIDYIVEETGLPRTTIRRVLEAERRYYLSLLSE